MRLSEINMSKIICGPVVGLVTTSSANVLLEVNESVSVEMCLKNSSTGHTQRVTVKLTGKVPGMFLFTSLDSDNTYHIIVPDITGRNVLGRVRTFPDDIRSLGVGVVSCDQPESAKKDFWPEFYTRAMNENIGIVLHMGDNVYIDGASFSNHSTKDVVQNEDITFNPKAVDQNNAYIKARKLLKGVAKDDWHSKKQEILNIYRAKYRSVFTKKWKAKVLANFCNMMILDDHEIRDDFGILPEDSDADSREFFLGSLAIQVYHEYQRQLWDPNVFLNTDKLTSEYYAMQFGPLKIVMTDSRTSRALYKHRRDTDDDTYYGRQQCANIHKSLVPDDVTRLCLLIYTMPMFFLKRKISQLTPYLAEKYDDVKLIATHHPEEIEPVLNAIENFKMQTGDRADVIMLAGDIHIGGFTDIVKKKHDGDELICRQITTSAINNHSSSLVSYTGLRAVMNFVDTFGDYTYKHYDWTKEQNFALLSVDFRDPDKLQYTVQLVDPLATELRQSSASKWDTGMQTVTSACCTML